MELPSYIRKLTQGETLTQAEMTDAMTMIMTGAATPAQIGGFLIGLQLRGETVEQISAAASVMRQLASKVVYSHPHLVDTCGTGGDASHTFNISTASALVAAAAGAKVAKHGNRSASSQSGSADVLEAAGVNLNLTPEQVAQCLDQVGVGFLFAQLHHSAMRHAIGPRKELGVRTIFNVLGPLTNPASAPNQVLGVFSRQWLRPLAEVLKQLGSRHIMVVHGAEGLDEISIAGDSYVAELKAGEIREYTLNPADFGLQCQPLTNLRVDTPADSLAMIQQVLSGEKGAARDIVLLNAGAAIYTAGVTNNHQEGITLAQQVIDSGKANTCLQQLITLTQQFKSL